MGSRLTNTRYREVYGKVTGCGFEIACLVDKATLASGRQAFFINPVLLWCATTKANATAVDRGADCATCMSCCAITSPCHPNTSRQKVEGTGCTRWRGGNLDYDVAPVKNVKKKCEEKM